MEERNIPTLRGFISYDGPKYCQIAVWCDYCRCNHYHGWPDRTTDPAHLEHRECHCAGGRGRPWQNSPYREHGYLIGIGPHPRKRPRKS